MKKLIGILILALMGIVVFTACNKDYVSKIQDLKANEDVADQISLTSLEPQVMVKGSGKREDYRRVVVEEIVKSKDCREIIAGVVEFYYEDKLVFAVDFGDGACDEYATITWVEDDGTVNSTEVPANEVFKKDREKGDCERSRCFEFVLPVTFKMPDNSTITIETKDDWSKIRAWHEANPRARERAKVQFPVDIILKNGETKTLNAPEDLRRAENFCRDKESDEKRCFEFVLPATFTMPDNSTITIETKEDRAKIKAWHEAHPNVKERAKVQFPVDIILKNGETKTLNAPEDLRRAEDFCNDKKGDEKRCFEFVLPATFTMPDNSTITIETKEDWAKIKAWHEANPNVKERAKVQFPVDIILKNGETKTLNAPEDLRGAEDFCKDKERDEKRCFEFVLPATFTMPDNSTITIETKEDWAKIKAWHEAHPNVKERAKVQFPVDIKLDNGETKTLNAPEDLKAAKERCQENKNG